MVDLGDAMPLNHFCELADVCGVQHFMVERVPAHLHAVAAHDVVRAVPFRKRNRQFSAQLPVGANDQNAR
jgi:hypothetical protein